MPPSIAHIVEDQSREREASRMEAEGYDEAIDEPMSKAERKVEAAAPSKCVVCGAPKRHRIGKLCSKCRTLNLDTVRCECGAPKSRNWSRCKACYLANCKLSHRYPGISVL